MKSSAPKSTPIPNKGEVKSNRTDDYSKVIFISSALDMSWQLALVVLIPIIGGYEIDNHFKTLPLWTIIGFVLATLGAFMVIRRALLMANQAQLKKPSKRKQ